MTRTPFAALAVMLAALAGAPQGGAAQTPDNPGRQATPTPPDQAPPTVPQRGDGASSGSSLSHRLSRDQGVVKPPPTVDRGVLPPPPTGPGSTPVIPPPGTQGGSNEVEPK